MIKYGVFFEDVEIGLLEINEKGQHWYTLVREQMEYIVRTCGIFSELCQESGWRDPIPVLHNRIRDAKRFHEEENIWNHTDGFGLVMIHDVICGNDEETGTEGKR